MVSSSDPQRVFAAFGGWSGVFRSDDGTTHWTYLPLAGLSRICADPFDSQRLYAAAGNGLYVSTDGGDSWSNLGWNTSPSVPAGGPADDIDPDPHHPGRLLVALRTSSGTVSLFASTDYGVSWQSVVLPQALAGLKEITNIAFDPETSGSVYFTTPGQGIYKSADGGTSWERIDDRRQPDMANETNSQSLTIAETLFLRR